MAVKIDSVYIAASSQDIDRVKHWTEHLRLAGIAVTSGWVDSIAENDGIANPRNVTRDVRMRYSRQNAEAIDKAHLLWFLMPAADKTTCGAWWEHGYAYKAGKFLVASGVDTERSVFCSFGHEFKDDMTAFSTICRFAREGAWAP